MGGEEEEEEEEVGREQRLSRSERLEGSPEKGDSSGFPVRGRVAGVREGHGGPGRVVGSFCRLPVAPRQSRSRAAEQFTGFPTGRPRGRGRGRACELPGRVLHAPSRPGAGGHPRGPGSPPLAAPLPAAPRTARRRGAEAPGPSHSPSSCWPLLGARLPQVSAQPRVPSPHSLFRLTALALRAEEDWRVPATPKTTGSSGAARGAAGGRGEPPAGGGEAGARGARGSEAALERADAARQ